MGGHLALAVTELGYSCTRSDHKTADGKVYPKISNEAVIVLKAKNSNQLKKLVETCRTEELKHTVFAETMKYGTWEEQVENTAKKTEAELEFWGVALFGDVESVSAATKKFSLYK